MLLPLPLPHLLLLLVVVLRVLLVLLQVAAHCFAVVLWSQSHLPHRIQCQK